MRRRDEIVCRIILMLPCFASFMFCSEILILPLVFSLFSGFSWLSKWAWNLHSVSHIIVSEMAMSLLNFFVVVVEA